MFLAARVFTNSVEKKYRHTCQALGVESCRDESYCSAMYSQRLYITLGLSTSCQGRPVKLVNPLN
jgi:hypothetical protein